MSKQRYSESRRISQSGWIKLGSSPRRSNSSISKEKLNKGRSWAQLARGGIKTEAVATQRGKESLVVDIDFKVKGNDFEKVYPDIYTSVVNIQGSKIKIKKESSRSSALVNVEVHVDVKKGVVGRIYPDILIMLINFMDLRSYLNFASGSGLYSMSLLNSPFIKYLQIYFPEEYKYLIENKDIVLQRHRDLNKKSSYLIYEIHKILYPDYYDYLDEDEYPNEYETEDEPFGGKY